MELNKKITYLFIFVAFLALITETVVGAASAPAVNMELVGHFSGQIRAMDIVGNCAYIGQGQNFLILNISNSSSPALVSNITTEDIISEVKVSGNYAYIDDGKNGLLIFDISNSSSPVLLGNYNNASDAYDISNNYVSHALDAYDISGNYLYVAAGLNDFSIFDISNPSSPFLKGSYDTVGYVTGVSVLGNYAYITNWDNLSIFDISNLSSPFLKGSYDTGGPALGVSVSGNYACVVGGTGLSIFDISNLSSPILIGNYSEEIVDGDAIMSWAPTDVLVSGNYVYVTDADGDFSIFDISNPSSPFLKGSYDTGGYARGVLVSGDYVYIASDYGLHILKTNLEQTPIPIADFNVNTTYGYAPLLVQFTDRSGNTNGWNWNFGDEATSNEQNPKHTYFKPGTYRVSLLVNNANGISYPVTKVIYVGYGNWPHVADFSTNVTSGCAPLSVQFTDLSKDTKWRIWYFGDGESSNETNTTHVYTKEGNYNVYLSASNEIGTVSKNITITVQNEKSSHTSSGSGGSAGSSPEPQSNIEVKELSQAFIANGKPVKFDFPRNATPIVSVSFDSKKTVGKTTTIVEMLENKSILVLGEPSEEVYKYLNIWVGNGGFGDTNNIANAIVYFKVEKAWIQDKKIDKSSITLNRYSDKTWNQLPTSLSNEDDKYLYLTAQTRGFSPFAITCKTVANENVTEIESQPSTQGLEQSTNIAAANTKQTQSPNVSSKGNTKSPGFEAFCEIFILLAVFLYKKR
jgi:PGF-pre-PGF domain-containing protein